MKRPAYNLLQKIVRMRMHLLKNSIGKRNVELLDSLNKVKIWVEAWPNAPEHGCIKFIQTNYNEVMRIIPSCKASEKLITELNTLIHEKI